MPLLYSFRRCPYAMRARMALLSQGITVELREVLLREKPPSMLAVSPKGTVPVLITDDEQVIDESLEIMSWALPPSGPWFAHASFSQQLQLVNTFDERFKPNLDAYKYSRPDAPLPQSHYRDMAELCLADYEQWLDGSDYLLGDTPQFLDIAVMPFLRQFAAVDRHWFDSRPQQRLCRWLDKWLTDPLFMGVMGKFPQWQEGYPGETWPHNTDVAL